jgi:hypothetical protein
MSVAKIRTDISSMSVPRTSATRIASEYASSPVAQPALQMRSSLPRARLLDHLGQDLTPEVVEQLRVTEEVRHLDQEAADQPLVLFRVAAEVLTVLLNRVLAGVGHAALETTANGRLAIPPEVDAAAVAHLLQQRQELAIFTRRERRIDAGHQVAQQRPDRIQIRDDIHGRGRQRPRQLRKLCRLRILHHDRPTGLLDPASSLRAIRAGAGQDHPDQALAERLRRRL